MLAIIGIIFPVFAAIGLGYATVWRGLFSQADLRILGRFVLNIALPGLIFNAVAGSELSQAMRPDWMLIYALTSVCTLAITYFAFTAMGAEPTRRAIAAMGAACPNSGYVAYPILLLALPAVAGQTFAMAVVVENFFIVPLTIVISDLATGNRDRKFYQIIGPILWGVIKRPMIIALLLGMAMAAFGIHLPAPIQRFMSMLANATAAVALFVIGGSLFGLGLRGNVAAAAKVAIAKLFLHPAIGLAMVTIAFALGIDQMGPDLRAALLITCATPMMGIYTILAQEYGHEGMASIAMLIATVGAFFTYSGLLFLLM